MKNTICHTFFWAASAVLALSNPASAQVGANNSYASMMSYTSTLTNNFTTDIIRNQSRNSGYSSASPSTPVQPAPGQTQPGQTLFPITAADFQGVAGRQLPQLLVRQMQGVTPQQKLAIQQMYYQILTDYERTNRSGNVACAIAYAIRVSLELDRGRKLTQDESDNMIQLINNALANNPQFITMTPQQKQMAYESSILTGGMAAVLYVEGQQQRNAAFQLQAREIAQSVLRQWGI